MSSSPSSSSSTSPPSTTSSTVSSSPTPYDATPKNDKRILTVVVILGIAAFFLVLYIIHITIKLKRRQRAEGTEGPFAGTVLAGEHLAAKITPFGEGVAGSRGPRYNHTPGSDMRIALRRPDGAWHFADSRTPFTPVGVSEIDVLPSPTVSTSSLGSFNSITGSRHSEPRRMGSGDVDEEGRRTTGGGSGGERRHFLPIPKVQVPGPASPASSSSSYSNPFSPASPMSPYVHGGNTRSSPSSPLAGNVTNPFEAPSSAAEVPAPAYSYSSSSYPATSSSSPFAKSTTPSPLVPSNDDYKSKQRGKSKLGVVTTFPAPEESEPEVRSRVSLSDPFDSPSQSYSPYPSHAHPRTSHYSPNPLHTTHSPHHHSSHSHSPHTPNSARSRSRDPLTPLSPKEAEARIERGLYRGRDPELGFHVAALVPPAYSRDA
ncbi:hypothetical protein BJ165DRAFT_1117351 [Panaeolus papilionaceus]|nr:hypothetical protein BJ165DRAFT_1117351 [Panaeolus papilionaceus]